ncbi:DoxX family protein [Nocardia acidivorans]|uniref:DoxX family protein n=1 Tax=Nocardia acidivorans TaxID=404580 RepID=UPI00082D3954|nr:DoxX family protein [Nocardia acidivorans]
MSTLTPRRIAYLLSTGAILTETAVGAQWDLTRNDYVRDTLDHLGYPVYFATIMGTAKAAAVATLLTPGTPRLKEWAYAGLTFVYAGAALSHFATKDAPKKIIPPAVATALAVASWTLRPAGE